MSTSRMVQERLLQPDCLCKQQFEYRLWHGKCMVPLKEAPYTSYSLYRSKVRHPDHTTVIEVDESLFWIQTAFCNRELSIQPRFGLESRLRFHTEWKACAWVADRVTPSAVTKTVSSSKTAEGVRLLQRESETQESYSIDKRDRQRPALPLDEASC